MSDVENNKTNQKNWEEEDDDNIPASKKASISSSSNNNNNNNNDDDDDEEEEEEGSDPVMISPSSSSEKEGSNNNNFVDAESHEYLNDPSINVKDVSSTTKDVITTTTTTTTTTNKRLVAVTPPSPSLSSSFLSFIAVGLQRKASPWKLEHWIELSLTLDGRDKITKTLQYISRLLSWWFLLYSAKSNAGTTSYRQHQSIRFQNLYQALSNSRKAFRLGRSITEANKIASMGLVGLLCWHVKQHIHRMDNSFLEDGSGNNNNNNNNNTSPPTPTLPPKTILHRASSNIGWGPMTIEDLVEKDKSLEKSTESKRQNASLLRSFSSMAYRKMYRPMVSSVVTTLASDQTLTVPWWMATGSVLKLFGLFGFWLGDNMNFLTSSGVLDNYNLSNEQRLAQRKQWQIMASETANQAYFFGALSGLVTNAYAYYRFHQEKLGQAIQQYEEKSFEEQHHVDNGDDDVTTIIQKKEEREAAVTRFQQVQEKQFSLFLALLKSCVDVTVFSNNPGVDLHQKWRGRKNHEALHCLCGLISAGTVLYNNFPDAKERKERCSK